MKTFQRRSQWCRFSRLVLCHRFRAFSFLSTASLFGSLIAQSPLFPPESPLAPPLSLSLSSPLRSSGPPLASSLLVRAAHSPSEPGLLSRVSSPARPLLMASYKWPHNELEAVTRPSGPPAKNGRPLRET